MLIMHFNSQCSVSLMLIIHQLCGLRCGIHRRHLPPLRHRLRWHRLCNMRYWLLRQQRPLFFLHCRKPSLYFVLLGHCMHRLCCGIHGTNLRLMRCGLLWSQLQHLSHRLLCERTSVSPLHQCESSLRTMRQCQCLRCLRNWLERNSLHDVCCRIHNSNLFGL